MTTLHRYQYGSGGALNFLFFLNVDTNSLFFFLFVSLFYKGRLLKVVRVDRVCYKCLEKSCANESERAERKQVETSHTDNDEDLLDFGLCDFL